MMNTYQKLQLETRNARRQLHGCTNVDNALRILRVLRQPEFQGVSARHVAATLPRIVRAEAQAVVAAAWALDEKNSKDANKAWRTLTQKADTLFDWADQCHFESTQRDAIAALDRLLAERRIVA